MKAILCGSCHDFRALPPVANEAVSCRCGNVHGWWTDAVRGTMRIHAKNREQARVIGFNNAWLYAGFFGVNTDSQWCGLQAQQAEMTVGYLFHKDLRNHQVVIIRPGQSMDVEWADKVPREGSRREA